jgi:hypothetical protein
MIQLPTGHYTLIFLKFMFIPMLKGKHPFELLYGKICNDILGKNV